jgi:hypothetical protein
MNALLEAECLSKSRIGQQNRALDGPSCLLENGVASVAFPRAALPRCITKGWDIE